MRRLLALYSWETLIVNKWKQSTAKRNYLRVNVMSYYNVKRKQ